MRWHQLAVQASAVGKTWHQAAPTQDDITGRIGNHSAKNVLCRSATLWALAGSECLEIGIHIWCTPFECEKTLWGGVTFLALERLHPSVEIELWRISKPLEPCFIQLRCLEPVIPQPHLGYKPWT